MDPKALEQSLVLGAAGMTVLFVFMGGLIVLIHFYIKLATRFFPNGKKEPPAESGDPAADDRSEVAAAVAAAVRENGA